MSQAKEGILLDAEDRPIAGANPAAGERLSWEQFREQVRSRTVVRQISVPGWGIVPLTAFIALLIPIILILFVAGVAFVVLFKTFVSPLLRLVSGRSAGAR